MPYITKWNFAHIYLREGNVKRLTVKRLTGEFHQYAIVSHKPSLHTVHNCERMESTYKGIKPNSGSQFVINYPVAQLNENSFDEVDGTVEDFPQSLYFHLGFNQCTNCWKIERLNVLTEYDLMTPQEFGDQHESDLEDMREYWKNNPEEFAKFLGDTDVDQIS